jgi:hypothetical protein
MTPTLTAEAFGTLLALLELQRLRSVEPKVGRELVERGFAQDVGGFLAITPAGRHVAEARDVGQALGLVPRTGRRGDSRDVSHSSWGRATGATEAG